MATQYIIWTPAGPVYLNGTGSFQEILGGLYVNETQGATSLTPGAGSAVLTGFASTVAVGISLAPGAGSVVLTGFAPAIAADNALTPGADSVVLTGFAPTVAAGNSLAPGAGSIVITGATPALTFGTSLVPGAGSVVLTGVAPDVAAGDSLTADVGVITVTGFAPGVTEGDLLSPDAGSVVVTGYAPDLVVGVPVHLVIGGAGGSGGRYVRPEPLPPIRGAGESEQAPQVSNGLGVLGAGVWATQSAQAGHGIGALDMRQKAAQSLQRQQKGRATGWADLRGATCSFQGHASASGMASLSLTVAIRSGVSSSRPPNYDADVMAFEDDEFMSDLELEDV